MSRVGNKAIQIPTGVEVTISDGKTIVKGKRGQLSNDNHALVKIETKDGQITCSPIDNSKEARAMWGTTRNNINSLVIGVTEGFKKTLELIGVGYRAQVQGQSLILQLGFSHEINFPIPSGIAISCPKNTTIVVEGSDKQQVGQVAAEIRRYRKPEPYKGKGVRYEDEYVVRKEGKKK